MNNLGCIMSISLYSIVSTGLYNRNSNKQIQSTENKNVNNLSVMCCSILILIYCIRGLAYNTCYATILALQS